MAKLHKQGKHLVPRVSGLLVASDPIERDTGGAEVERLSKYVEKFHSYSPQIQWSVCRAHWNRIETHFWISLQTFECMQVIVQESIPELILFPHLFLSTR